MLWIENISHDDVTKIIQFFNFIKFLKKFNNYSKTKFQTTPLMNNCETNTLRTKNINKLSWNKKTFLRQTKRENRILSYQFELPSLCCRTEKIIKFFNFLQTLLSPFIVLIQSSADENCSNLLLFDRVRFFVHCSIKIELMRNIFYIPTCYLRIGKKCNMEILFIMDF